jgi:hypothetical protein
MLSATATKAIEAYGGAELWQNSKYLEAEVSVKGLAFTLKRRPFFEHAKIKMEIGRPFSKLTPIGKDKYLTGVLDGHNVRLEDKNETVVAERKNARAYFPYGRRFFYWDDLDMAYFANYAFWNYFTFPNLLMNKNILWQEKEAGLLQATFPESIPTHNQTQAFRIDMSSGILLQHNYTADIISSLAKAANLVTAHAETNGLKYPSARRVTPRLPNGKALKGPILIDITVHQFRLTNSELSF